MSTSFPNSNGAPPYNPQANGSFNQYGQGGPPGGYPGMDPYHNIYAPPANGYGNMAPVPPNMGAPPTAPPAAKAQPPQHFPGASAGAKLPAYDGNSMQNGYMGYPPHQPRPNGQVAQNGPPPNYNAQNAHMPHNPYAAVPDPYRMYSGMQGPPGPTPNSQAPTSQPGSTSTAPSNSFASQPGAPAQHTAPSQYPAQQQLPAHLHGAPPFQGMPPQSNAPLQHYQPPGYSNGNTTPSRGGAGQALPSLQPSKQAKQEEARPNNLSTGAANSQYPNPYAAANAQPVYDPYNAGPNGYPGYGAHGNQGPSGSTSTPGVNGGNMTPGATGHFGYNPGLYSNSGPATSGQSTPGANNSGQNTPGHRTPGNQNHGQHTPGQHTPGQHTPGHNTSSGSVIPVSNPYATVGTPGTSQGHFGGNDHSGNHTSGNYGSNHQTPNNANERGTPGAQSAPGTPHSVGSGTPKQQLTPQQQQQSGMHMTPPPQYNQMVSPSHVPNGATPQKHPNSSPMGSSLPPLNGQYPQMTHNMQSPVTTPTEPTFKEPAIPIRHSPSHMQSPQHQQPSGAPPAYNAPSNSAKVSEIPSMTPTQPAPPQKSPSPTFAVPTLPAAKPKTSPQKKRGDEPDPPSADTPFTTVTHYELPPAMPELRNTLSIGPDQKTIPPVEKYFTRKRPQLRFPYPEGVNAHTAPATEPNTFGFIEGSKYFAKNGARKLACQPPGPPMLNRSQSMQNAMVSPGFVAPTPPTGGRQPAKKARSASDASEPTFNMPIPPRQPARPMDPRQMQQMQMQQYQQQMQMQKLHQQQQYAAHQQHMARMAQGSNMPSTSTAGAVPPAPLGNQLPPLAPPALQRAESLPQLPSQQQPPMGGAMPPHMGGGMPQMNGAPTEGYYRADGQQQYWPPPAPQHQWPAPSDFGKLGPGWDTKP